MSGRRLSVRTATGIPIDVRASVLTVLLFAPGCELPALSERDLFGADPGAMAGVVPDAAVDIHPDAAVDVHPDAAVDVHPGTTGDAFNDALAACTPASCAAGRFCDEGTGQCTPQSGEGVLSGIVRDACTRRDLDARVAIAGRRQCTSSGKGMYYFSGLPVGFKLTLSARKDGYQPYDAVIVLGAQGNPHDIALMPQTPQATNACAGPMPADIPCRCEQPGCQ